MHLTFLFEARKNATDANLVVQIRLCLDVLENIIRVSANQLRKTLTTESWETWIKLLLGITDSIFVNNKTIMTPSSHQHLEKSLGPSAFKVLMEVWLLSHTKNTALWTSLLSLIPNWVRVATILHWNSISYALSQRTLALLYGPKYGSSQVVIDWHSSTEDKPISRSIIRLEPEFTFYAWHRVLHALPNPSGFSSPDVYSTFFTGIEKVVDAHHTMADKGQLDPQLKETKKKIPNSNTILAIFGRWLFESVMIDKAGFEDGTSTSCRVLCKIFSRAGDDILTLHLANFYGALSKVLTKNINDKVIMTALIGMKHLFTKELKGSYVLIPYFFTALSQVWREGGPSSNIRSTCIDFMSTLLCFADHFNNAEIVTKVDKPVNYSSTRSQHLPDLSLFVNIKKHMRTLFYIAIAREDNPSNIIKLLWNIVVFLNDVSEFDMKEENEEYLVFCGAIITEILRNCQNHTWNTEVILSAYSSIASLTTIYPYFGKGQLGISKSILTKLSEHIISCAFSIDSREDNDKIIQRALMTLTDWFLVDPNFPTLHDADTINLMIYAVVTSLGETTNNGSKYTPSPNVKDTAEFALNNILTSSSFPNTIGPHTVSSEVTEADILEELASDYQQASQYMRTFVLDDQIILTLIDFPEMGHKGHVYLFARDVQGRHVWRGNSKLYENQEALNPIYKASDEPPVTTPIHTDRYEKDVKESNYESLLQFLNNIWTDRMYPGGIIANTKTYVETEKAHLTQTKHGLQYKVRFDPPERYDPYSSDCKFQYSRILLSNLGLLLPDTYYRIRLIEDTNASRDIISQLDRIPERETISLGVILIEKEPEKPFDYLVGESPGPADYQDFLSSIGWGVNLWAHTGYRGGLVHESTGDYAPYYANYSTEVIFEVANWMPDSPYQDIDHAISEKRTLFNESHVHIVWNLTNSFKPPSGSLKEMCYIVIYPMRNGLYKIRILNKEGKPFGSVGPLLDQMIVAKRVLGVMVRLTAISIHRLLSQDSGPISALRRRRQKIAQISKEYSRPQPFDDFLTALFSKKLKAPMSVQPKVAPTVNPSTQQGSNTPTPQSSGPTNVQLDQNMPQSMEVTFNNQPMLQTYSNAPQTTTSSQQTPQDLQQSYNAPSSSQSSTQQTYNAPQTHSSPQTLEQNLSSKPDTPTSPQQPPQSGQ